MLIKLRERMGREEGFTLIELLVVMLILGILAAIAIPAFFSQRDKARDADAKTMARTAQTAAEAYATDQPNGNYAGLDETDLPPREEVLNDAVNLAASEHPVDGADGFVVSADSDTGTTFEITRDGTGAVTRSCDDPGAGGCQDDGNGGGTW